MSSANNNTTDLRQRSSSSLSSSTTMTAPSLRSPRRKSLIKGHSHQQGVPTVVVAVIGVIGTLVVILALQGGIGLTSNLRGGVERKVYEEMTKEKEALQKQYEELKKMAGGDPEEITKVRDQAEYLRQYKYRMHRNIKEMSRQSLMQEYGPGPYYAEMILSFDPLSNVADKTKPLGNDTESILLEMAPPDLMPATVLFFLRQINATVYDGCSFHRNAGHVLQAGPAVSFETESNDNLWKKFRESGLESVPFQEYSPDFTHKLYTLGYAGRPGGPDFYISTQDNTVNHGPGGQASFGDTADADPCFAKVVPGFESAVQRMHKSDVQPDDYNHMEHSVAIRSIRIVSAKDAAIRIAHVNAEAAVAAMSANATTKSDGVASLLDTIELDKDATLKEAEQLAKVTE